jgi:hypothetical protein
MPKIHETWTVLPNGPLVEIDERILTVAGDIPMPLGNFPRRMTVVGLSGGRTAVWSAVALQEADMSRIEALGRPAVLIVPNPGHRLDAKIWKERYPDIVVLTPPGAKKLVEDVVPVDATEDVLDDPEASFILVQGTVDSESALKIRRPGGVTLVTNDIIGHVRKPHGIGANIMARLFTYGLHGPSVPWTVRRFIKDKHALARQMREWAEIDGLKRIIVSHGEPITDDPAGTLRRLAGGLEI